MKIFKGMSVFFSLALLLTVTCFAQGAVTSGIQTATIQATQGESITVALTGSPVTMTFGGAYSTPLTAVVSYNLVSANHTQGIAIGAWFSSATAALTGPVNLPASDFGFKVGGTGAGTGYTGPCSSHAGTIVNTVEGATCMASVYLSQSQLITTPAGSWTDIFSFNYTSATPAPAGSYTGTFLIDYIAP